MDNKSYLNIGLIISIIISISAMLFITIFIFDKIYDNPFWVPLVAYIVVFIFILLVFGRMSPFVMIIYDDKTIKFFGTLWIYALKRDWMEDVVIEPTGIMFKPKEEYKDKFKWVTNSAEERYKDYKVIKFANYRAMGVLIEVMKPISKFEAFDKLSPKWREYFLKKLYDEKRDLVENFK